MKHRTGLYPERIAVIFDPDKGIVISSSNSTNADNSRKYYENKRNESWMKANMKEHYDRDKGEIDFWDRLRVHGCDELGTSAEERSKVDYLTAKLNNLLKKKAISDKRDGYRQYTPDKLYKCGNWYFAIWADDKYVEIDYNGIKIERRGGKREHAGRKATSSKLEFSDTTVIRVPRAFKDKIKQLIEFLITQEESEQSVRDALYNAVRALDDKIGEYRRSAKEYNSETYEIWAKEQEGYKAIVEKLIDTLPYVIFKGK